MNVWIVHDLCKACNGYGQFQKMFYLVSKRGCEDGLTPFDNDEDVLVMCIEKNFIV